MLKDILPDNLWLMGEVGTVAGRQKNFNHSKHISCVFRENFDNRSFANNETLVVTGALQEIPPGSDQCNAALIYGLRSNEEKLDWFSMSVIESTLRYREWPLHPPLPPPLSS